MADSIQLRSQCNGRPIRGRGFLVTVEAGLWARPRDFEILLASRGDPHPLRTPSPAVAYCVDMRRPGVRAGVPVGEGPERSPSPGLPLLFPPASALRAKARFPLSRPGIGGGQERAGSA